MELMIFQRNIIYKRNRIEHIFRRNLLEQLGKDYDDSAEIMTLKKFQVLLSNGTIYIPRSLYQSSRT